MLDHVNVERFMQNSRPKSNIIFYITRETTTLEFMYEFHMATFIFTVLPTKCLRRPFIEMATTLSLLL